MQTLLKSRQFWLAILAVGQAILFQFYPQFPDAIWQSIFALLMVVIVSTTVDDVGKAVARTLGKIIVSQGNTRSYDMNMDLIDQAMASWRKHDS